MAAEHPDRAPPALHCLTCSYDLSSLATGICPECGRAFDRDDPSTFDTRTRTKRLLIRIATGLVISVLCFGTMVGAAWVASSIEFDSFHSAVFSYAAVGAACALVTAIAAAWIRSWLARAILLVGGVLSMWPTLLLGLDRGYRVWQAQPDPPDEAFADGGPVMGALFLGWVPSGLWWLVTFGISLLVIRLVRRRPPRAIPSRARS